MHDLTANHKTVIAVFQDLASAERAVAALEQAGFTAREIGIEAGGHPAAELVRTLISMGVPEQESRAFDGARTAGRALVTVRSAGRQAEAEEILRLSEALLVDAFLPNQIPETPPGETGEPSEAGVSEPRRTLQLVEEELVAHLQSVGDGDLLIRKEVKLFTRTIEVSLKREELVVERRPARPQVTTPEGELAGGRPADLLTTGLRYLEPGQVIRITLAEEEPSIEKQVVVYEEVVLGKHVIAETRRLSAEVRREEFRIENPDSVPVHGG